MKSDSPMVSAVLRQLVYSSGTNAAILIVIGDKARASWAEGIDDASTLAARRLSEAIKSEWERLCELALSDRATAERLENEIVQETQKPEAPDEE